MYDGNRELLTLVCVGNIFAGRSGSSRYAGDLAIAIVGVADVKHAGAAGGFGLMFWLDIESAVLHELFNVKQVAVFAVLVCVIVVSGDVGAIGALRHVTAGPGVSADAGCAAIVNGSSSGQLVGSIIGHGDGIV